MSNINNIINDMFINHYSLLDEQSKKKYKTLLMPILNEMENEKIRIENNVKNKHDTFEIKAKDLFETYFIPNNKDINMDKIKITSECYGFLSFNIEQDEIHDDLFNDGENRFDYEIGELLFKINYENKQIIEFSTYIYQMWSSRIFEKHHYFTCEDLNNKITCYNKHEINTVINKPTNYVEYFTDMIEELSILYKHKSVGYVYNKLMNNIKKRDEIISEIKLF